MSRLTKERARTGYDEDFFAWTREVAQALRSGTIDPTNIEHVAEEIEDMGKRDRRELLSRLEVLLVHLIKCEIQPSRRSPSWLATIREQRSQIELLLQDSPSLVGEATARLNEIWARAEKAVVLETGASIHLLRECRVPIEVILDPAFIPKEGSFGFRKAGRLPGFLSKLSRPE
jgi:hypothetical protein